MNNDNVVIRGSSGFKSVFDAKNDNMSIFTVNGDNVRLENIVFKNCDCISWGGAVCINGKSCSVINCEFIDNSGHIGAMGISDNASNVLIKDCYFKNNMANNPSSNSGGSGGVINTHTSYGRYINCIFIDNTAVNYVEDCIFINNYAPDCGALHLAKISS